MTVTSLAPIILIFTITAPATYTIASTTTSTITAPINSGSAALGVLLAIVIGGLIGYLATKKKVSEQLGR